MILIPEVPVRQWVCSLPWRLRVLLRVQKFLARHGRTLDGSGEREAE